MQTGVITPDTYSNLLRDFSQKRRQGVLEIHTGDVKRELFFVNGRIAFVRLNDSDLFSPVAERFAETFPELVTPLPKVKTFRDLLELLAESVPIGEEVFRFYLKHYVLDCLYDIDFEQGGYYNFRFEMPFEEKDLLPGITVGQLLLDLVALEGDQELFESRISLDDYVTIVADYTGSPSAEERALLRKLEAGPCQVSELRTQTGLSLFAFQESLLSMIDRGVIALDDATPASKVASQDMFALLESSIDESFASEDFDLDAEPATLNGSAKQQSDEALFARPGALEGEELESEEEEDYESNFTMSEQLYVWNMRLAYVSWVPTLIALAVVVMGLFSPFLLWENLLLEFGEF